LNDTNRLIRTDEALKNFLFTVV